MGEKLQTQIKFQSEPVTDYETEACQKNGSTCFGPHRISCGEQD